jgi:DNA-binding CsgD family transcriptional regulator/PAS domain-containing protein
MARPEPSLKQFSQVIEAIYDCALEPERWRETLPLLAGFMRSPYAALAIHDYDQQRTGRVFDHGYGEAFFKVYQNYEAMNPMPAAAQLLPVGAVATMAMLIDEAEFFAGRFYNEFLRPRGIFDAISAVMLRSARRTALLFFNRSADQPRYGDGDVRLFELLAPHVRRAVTISDVLDLRTITSRVLEATLDALTTGVYLADREGRVVYMNQAAEQQIRTGKAVRIAGNSLAPVDPAARAALTQAIADIAREESAASAGGVTLALPDGRAGLVATILPLGRGQRRGISRPFAAAVAVFVQDPAVVPELPGEAFAKLHGLTGGELRVLLAISPGLGLKEAADMLGISENTAKTHLQGIFAKTGTSKQAELINLLRSSAPPTRAT